MSTSGISVIYIGTFIKGTAGFKVRKDYINIFKLNMMMISAEKKGIIILITLIMTKIIKKLKFPN